MESIKQNDDFQRTCLHQSENVLYEKNVIVDPLRPCYTIFPWEKSAKIRLVSFHAVNSLAKTSENTKFHFLSFDQCVNVYLN